MCTFYASCIHASIYIATMLWSQLFFATGCRNEIVRMTHPEDRFSVVLKTHKLLHKFPRQSTDDVIHCCHRDIIDVCSRLAGNAHPRLCTLFTRTCPSSHTHSSYMFTPLLLLTCTIKHHNQRSALITTDPTPHPLSLSPHLHPSHSHSY